MKKENVLGFNEASLKIIHSLPLLNEVPEDALKIISKHSYLTDFEEGDFIFKENDQENKDLFFLINGIVAVFKENVELCEIREKGDIFGEMSFLENLPRSASVLAKTDCTVIRLTAVTFQKLEEKNLYNVTNKFYQFFIQRLATKLRTTSKENSSLQEKIKTVESHIVDPS